MINRINKIVASTVLLGSLMTGTAHAASASMSLSPASATRTVGSTFTVNIYENSGSEPVNVAEASLSYNQSQLKLNSMSCGGGFEIAASASTAGISCGTVTAKTGNQLVGKATFKTLASSGSGAITIASGHVYSANSNSDIAGGKSGANYNFAVAAAAPAQAPAPTPAPEAPAPVKLFNVTIVVVDNKGDEVRDASVTIDGKKVSVSRSGIANFEDLKAGNYDVTVKSSKVETTGHIVVSEKNKTAQAFMVKLPAPKRRIHWPLFTSSSLLLVIAGGFMLRRKTPVVAKKKSAKGTKKSTATASKAKPVSKKKAVKKTTKKTATSKKK